MKTFMLIFAYVCGCLVVGCTSVSSKDEMSGETLNRDFTPKLIKRVTRADIPIRSEWLTVEQLKGTWEAYFKKMDFLTRKDGTPFGGKECDVSMMMAFDGNGHCEVRYAENGIRTSSYEIDYDRGFLLFKARSESFRDKALLCLKASTFEVVKLDDACFDLRYADLPALAEQLKSSKRSSDCEYLDNGLLRSVRVSNAFTSIELRYPMIFRKISDQGSLAGIQDCTCHAQNRKIDASIASRLQFASASEIQKEIATLRPDTTAKEKASVSPLDVSKRVQQKKQTKRVKHRGKKLYDILSIERTMDDGFAYRFELQIADGSETSLKAIKSVKHDFRKAIRDDYTESFFGSSVASVFVEFPQFMFSDGRIVGKAVVMSMVVLSVKYDPLTRTGCISVRLNDGHFEEARKWIRRNIEALVCDKNIALTTGEIPPAAKFYLGREELKDGNILEIEFKTE